MIGKNLYHTVIFKNMKCTWLVVNVRRVIYILRWNKTIVCRFLLIRIWSKNNLKVVRYEMLVSKGRSERLFLPCDRNSLRMAQGTNGMVWRAGPTTWAKCYGGWNWERKCRLRTKSVFLLKLHILQHPRGDHQDAEETRTHHFLSDNQPQYLRSTSLLWAPHHTYFNFKTTSCVCKSAESQLIVAGNKTQTGVGTSSKHTQGCSRYTDPPAAAAVTTSGLCSLSQLSSTTGMKIWDSQQ